MHRASLVLITCFGAGLLGCSGGGSGSQDAGGGGDAPSGSGGSSADAGGSDQGSSADGGACTQPLAAASSFCQATFADQVLANPCDNDSPTTRTCGTYKVWESLFIGSQTCVYDTTGTALAGARQCDSTFLPACTSGCIVYGIAESAYATCGADAPACP